jgi:3-oxoacyl-[acyl-carrier protein] reductase
MDLKIAGRRALIIGGSAGLGLASAEALAAEGVDLILFARNPDSLSSAAESIESRFGVGVEVVPGDLTDRSDVARLVERLSTTGRPDILVLNTPRPPSPMRDFLDETDDDRWEDAYRNQLEGALNILRAMGPIMRTGNWGRVIAITSASVKQPLPRHAISTIFRAGVAAALKHLSNELAPFGTTVNSVAPATIITPTFAAYHDVTERVALTPMKRAGNPAELGSIVAFLASDQAGYLTGQVIQLDGGRTASLF